MSRLKNEKGNASLYFIWFVFMCGVVMIFTVNIMDIFGKKEQAAIGAEQASIAATEVVLEAVLDGIEEYETISHDILPDELKKKSVFQEIEDERERLIAAGTPRPQAKLTAVNNILPVALEENKKLKHIILSRLYHVEDEVKAVAKSKIFENNGKASSGEIRFFDNGRIAVKSYAEYKTKVFDTVIPFMKQDIPYKGYGPKLKFIGELGWVNSTIYL